VKLFTGSKELAAGQQVSRLRAENERLRAEAAKNSGNSSKPPSRDRRTPDTEGARSPELAVAAQGSRASGKSSCVIRRKRTPVPAESGHPFRLIPDGRGTAPMTFRSVSVPAARPWRVRENGAERARHAVAFLVLRP
jgi:hypothetical protein